jgi:hypothetical protein
MAVFDLPDSAEKEKRRLQNQKRQALFTEQRRSSAIEQGRKAWANWERTGSTQLEMGDRQAIAKCLGQKIEAIKEKDGRGALTKLIENVKYLAQPMTLKHLDKLTIKSGGRAEKDLAAAPNPYQSLIQALAKYTGENLYVLADEMLLLTQFHPVGKVQLEEAQLILDALQAAVDRIDREFHLWEQCQAVAAVRKPLEEPFCQALRNGNEAAVSEFFDANPSHIVGNPIKLWWPIDDMQLSDLVLGTEPFVNPFWATRYSVHGANAAGVWSGEEIFFFPHIYLGPAIEWSKWIEFRDGYPQPTMSSSAKEEILASIKAEPEPRVLFNEETGDYQVYKEGTEPSERRVNGTDWDWGDGWMDAAARWLVIYPDPDAKQLVPAVYTRGDMWFTELVPLSARLIAEVGDGDRWQYFGHNAPTLLQRLKDLTGFGTGDFKVMDAWRETAERFHLNPIFRSHPGEDKKILYRRHLERWIAENRRFLDSYEDEE